MLRRLKVSKCSLLKSQCPGIPLLTLKARYASVPTHMSSRLLSLVAGANSPRTDDFIDGLEHIQDVARMADSEVEHLLRGLCNALEGKLSYDWYVLLSHPKMKELCHNMAKRAIAQHSASICTLMLKFVAVTDEVNAFYKKYTWLRRYLPALLDCIFDALSQGHFDIYAQTRILSDLIRLSIPSQSLAPHASQLFSDFMAERDKVLALPNFIFVALFRILAYFPLAVETPSCLRFLSQFDNYITTFTFGDLIRIYIALSQLALFHASPLLRHLEEKFMHLLLRGAVDVPQAAQILEGLFLRKGDESFNASLCSLIFSFFGANILKRETQSAVFKRIFVLFAEIATTHPFLMPQAETIMSLSYEDFKSLPFFNLMFFLESMHAVLTNKRIKLNTPLQSLYIRTTQLAFKAHFAKTGEVHPALIHLPQLWHRMIELTECKWQSLTSTSQFVIKYILACQKSDSPRLTMNKEESTSLLGFRLIEFDFPSLSPEFLPCLLPPLHVLMRLPFATYKLMRFLEHATSPKIAQGIHRRLQNIPYRYFDMRKDDVFQYKHFFAYALSINNLQRPAEQDLASLLLAKWQLLSDLTDSARMLKILRIFAGQVVGANAQKPAERLVDAFYLNNNALSLVKHVILRRCNHAAIIECLKASMMHASASLKKSIIECLTDQLIKVDSADVKEHFPAACSTEMAFLYPHLPEARAIIEAATIKSNGIWAQLSNPFLSLEDLGDLIVDEILALDQRLLLRALIWLMARAQQISEKGILALVIRCLPFEIWEQQNFYEEVFYRLELYVFPPLESKIIFYEITQKVDSAFQKSKKLQFTLCEQIARLAVRFRKPITISLDTSEGITLQEMARLETLLFRAASPSVFHGLAVPDNLLDLRRHAFELARALCEYLSTRLSTQSLLPSMHEEINALSRSLEEWKVKEINKNLPPSVTDSLEFEYLVVIMEDLSSALRPELPVARINRLPANFGEFLERKGDLVAQKCAQRLACGLQSLKASFHGPLLYMKSREGNKLLILAPSGLLSCYYAEFLSLFVAKKRHPSLEAEFIGDADVSFCLDSNAASVGALGDTWINFSEEGDP